MLYTSVLKIHIYTYTYIAQITRQRKYNTKWLQCQLYEYYDVTYISIRVLYVEC